MKQKDTFIDQDIIVVDGTPYLINTETLYGCTYNVQVEQEFELSIENA